MEDLDQKMGYLAGLDGFEKVDLISDFEENYDFTFVFFKDFDEKYLFEFLGKMRANDLAIDHKAGITPTNINWTLRYLLDENDQEHKTMLVVNEINSYLKKASQKKEETGEENLEIKNLVRDLNLYFKTSGENFDINVAHDFRDKIKDLVENL